MDQNRKQGQQPKRPKMPPERGSGSDLERNRRTYMERDRQIHEELEEQEKERQSER